MKFLCDQMLAGLGRWLRVAGYDTVIIEERLEDREILQRAIKEDRILLTADRQFFEMAASEKKVIFLKANHIEECVKALNEKLKINWLYAPFSRCLICNSLLEETTNPLFLEKIPAKVRTATNRFWYCPRCDKVYWQGSHTERMLEQLKNWSIN